MRMSQDVLNVGEYLTSHWPH